MLKEKTLRGVKEWPIIGNASQVNYLRCNVEDDDIAHAYLFLGEEKIGKKTTALAFAKAILCGEAGNSDFCGKCDTCRKIDAISHPDVAVLDSDSMIKIEEIRNLLSNLSLKPFNSTHKIAIIDNAERMTEDAANALLKTLEEPSGHAVIILIAQSKNSLLPTIVSRTRVVKFFPVSNAFIEESHLSKFKDEKMREIAILVSSGRPGKLWEIESNEELLSFFKESVDDLFRLASGDTYGALEYSGQLIQEHEKEPQKVTERISSWILALREILYARHRVGYKSGVINVDLLKTTKTRRIVNTIENLSSSLLILKNTKSGLNIKLLLDILMLKIPKLGQ